MNKSEHIWEKMNYLSKLEDAKFPFITLYMNVNAHNFLDQAEQNRIFLKNSIQDYLEKNKDALDREQLISFQNDLDKIKSYIKNELSTQTHGMAIFACDQLGIFETFDSVIPFENEFIVDSFAHLKQLAFQCDELENALVVMLDSRHSLIFEVRIGGSIIPKAAFEGDIHRFHKQGGWSQKRYQRGVEQEKDWHYKETAQNATILYDEQRFDNIILLGQEHEVRKFMKHLPKRVRTRVDSIDTYPQNLDINILLEKVINNLSKKEREREFILVKEIIDKASSQDGCCLGIDETIDLAQAGRIDTLAVVENEKIKGYKAGDCLYSHKGQKKPDCPACDETSQDTDLIEELIRITVKNGGNVEMIQHETPAGDQLEQHDGVGAFLRY